MAENEQEMDLETLQAQIDMSMAFTHNLVAGWMKSSKAKLPSASSRANDDAELEEYLRRPSRLGVGASVPDSTSVLSRESAKLRSKLVGAGKKRAREEDQDALPSRGAPAPIVVSDDEEESRARVITKKARVDPFETKGKKKKQKGNPGGPLEETSQKKSHSNVNPAIAPVPKENTDSRARVSPVSVIDVDASDAAPISSSSKTKKKKKHKKHSKQGDQTTTPEALLTASKLDATSARSQTIGNIDRALAHVEMPLAKTSASDNKHSAPEIGTRGATVHVLSDTPMSPGRTAQAVPHSPLKRGPGGLPLLNLDGPPPVSESAPGESLKKKRRKRNKKKKTSVVPGTAEVIDVDADD